MTTIIRRETLPARIRNGGTRTSKWDGLVTELQADPPMNGTGALIVEGEEAKKVYGTASSLRVFFQKRNLPFKPVIRPFPENTELRNLYVNLVTENNGE